MDPIHVDSLEDSCVDTRQEPFCQLKLKQKVDGLRRSDALRRMNAL